MMQPTIIEVVGRSSQGYTKPFICRADDGEVYFVKGRHAGSRSLVCEWLAGSLAKKFGLPIAPFSILNVPEELIKLGSSAGEPLSELGAGFVFGSRRCVCSEMTITTAENVPDAVKRDVVVFDWWVRNEDRTLSESGGNPNLFWNEHESKLLVVDHNLAFDPAFNADLFLSTHAFADELRNVASDFIKRTEYALRLSDTLSVWPAAVDAIPELWHYIDPEQTVPLDFEFAAVKAMLESCRVDAFWQLGS